MKYFAMCDIINDAILDKFIPFFNENQSVPCTIVLHSRGGQTYVTDIIIRMIGQMEDVTLTIHSVYSAALKIAIQADCKKVLSSTAKGMWHMGRADMSVAIDTKPYYDEDINHVKNFEIEAAQSIALANKIMTKKEFRRFKVKREEVWFDFKRMKQIFPDAEIIK